MATSLTEAQEIILLEIRNMLLLPLDDLLVIARKFIKAEMTRSSLYRLLKRHGASSLCEACPARIETILTGNGTQFTDRFLGPNKKANGTHPFGLACAQGKIGYRLIPSRHPQTDCPPSSVIWMA
jgi:hypothetical protein